jgi:hypothetical protein
MGVVASVHIAFFVVSGFAGLLPVVSWVLIVKWLIFNGIRFCR